MSIENRKMVENFIINEKKIPITELSNCLTKNIDLARSGEEILNLLSKTDQEIFMGWEINSNLITNGFKNDLYIIEKISNLSRILFEQAIDKKKKIKLILSGCGTSGRIAYLCSQTFNYYLKTSLKNKFENLSCDYIIAGDEPALVNSVESIEDKLFIGEKKLESILEQNTYFVYIGITCGLSAPFVAGQLNYCLKNVSNDRLIACGIIGFNPVEMTRKTQAVNENNQNFYDLMLKLKEFESNEPKKFFILNPYIGPEPVTGSTRMKSGTTTKIILDLIMSKMLCMFENKTNINELDLIDFYEISLNKVVYTKETIHELGELIDKSADGLRNLKKGGSINYLSDSERLGLLCCVDASECLPTYGASKNDFKGFVSAANGTSLSNFKNNNQWNGFIQNCDNSWSENILKNMNHFESSKCVFILIDDNDYNQEGMSNLGNEYPTKNLIERKLIENSNCQIYHLNLSSKLIESTQRIKTINFEHLNEILESSRVKVNSYFSNCIQEFVLKLLVNSISTGAHILSGKTYENIMIDVKVSNIKLYWRAVGILNKFSGLELVECENYLIKSIYQGDYERGLRDNLEDRIQVATNEDLIVSKALVMALIKCSFNEATKLLNESNNSVRNCIFNLKNREALV